MSIKSVIDEVNTLSMSKQTTLMDVYQAEHECKKHLTTINSRLELCINMFNTVIKDICKSVSNALPNDPTITTYNEVITEIITEKPLEPISLFILYVYKDQEYREAILAGKESFFIDGDHNKMTQGDRTKVAQMFQFKNSWKNFDEDQKDYIKNATKMLVQIAEKYIIEKDDGNKIAGAMMKLSSIKPVNK